MNNLLSKFKLETNYKHGYANISTNIKTGAFLYIGIELQFHCFFNFNKFVFLISLDFKKEINKEYR